MTMNDPLFEAIGMALLHLLWQGALAAGVLAVALRILSRKSALTRYALSCFALASLLTLGITTAVRSYESGSPSPVLTPSVSEAAAGAAQPAATTPVPTLMLAAAMIRLYAPEIVLLWLAGVAFLTIRL